MRIHGVPITGVERTGRASRRRWTTAGPPPSVSPPGLWRKLAAVSTQRDDDDFDRWVTEKGGPEAVVAMIDMKRRVADGSLPGFRDKEALLAYWADGRHEPT